MNRNSWRGRNTDTNAFNADAGSLYASLSCPMDAHPVPLPRPRLSLCTVCAPFFGWALFAGCLIEMFAGVATVQQRVAEKGAEGGGEVQRRHLRRVLCATSKHSELLARWHFVFTAATAHCNNAAGNLPLLLPLLLVWLNPFVASVRDVWSVSLRTCSGHSD